MAKKSGTKAPPEDVESYLATVPRDAVASLRALRKAIREAAPDAEEVISYGVPTYRHRGPLVSFAATSRHCPFYVMSPGPIAARQEELEAYDTAPTAIRFPAGQPLPATLVKTTVKERMKENETK